MFEICSISSRCRFRTKSGSQVGQIQCQCSEKLSHEEELIKDYDKKKEKEKTKKKTTFKENAKNNRTKTLNVNKFQERKECSFCN